MSSSGGIDTAIDRIEAVGGDCVQVFTQSPRMWRPDEPQAGGDRARSARGGPRRGIGGVVCHALYLCNLAAPDDEIYEKSIETMRATVDAATAIGADGVIFHVGSHLGAGFDAGLERTTRRARADSRAVRRRHLAADGELGRRRRDDRPLARGAPDAARPPRPASAARHLPRLVPPLRVGLRRHRPATRSTELVHELDDRDRASTACARCT